MCRGSEERLAVIAIYPLEGRFIEIEQPLRGCRHPRVTKPEAQGYSLAHPFLGDGDLAAKPEPLVPAAPRLSDTDRPPFVILALGRAHLPFRERQTAPVAQPTDLSDKLVDPFDSEACGHLVLRNLFSAIRRFE